MRTPQTDPLPNLGIKLGQRLADELGVTIYDLGAPTAQEVAAEAASLLDRVDALEADLAEARLEIDALRRQRDGAA